MDCAQKFAKTADIAYRMNGGLKLPQGRIKTEKPPTGNCGINDRLSQIISPDSGKTLGINPLNILLANPAFSHYDSIESTTTRTAGGLDFAAKGGKRQGRAVPRSLRVKPGATRPVW